MNIDGALPTVVKTALAAVTHRLPSRFEVVRAELADLSAAATRCLDRRLAGLPPLEADEVPTSIWMSRGPALRAELKKLAATTYGAPSNPNTPRPNSPRPCQPRPPDTPKPKGNPSPSNPKPGNKRPASPPQSATR